MLKARTVVAAYVAEQEVAAENKANNKRLQEGMSGGSAQKKTFTSSKISLENCPAATVTEADAAVAKFSYA